MCGITGYVGERASVHVVVDQLRRLEYRGYDSAGVASPGREGVRVIKSVGKISALQPLLQELSGANGTAIGHTRWATHGAPSDANAHPHVDCTGRIAVVHNGIIENYLALRESLTARGHTLVSETDTEVLPHLIEESWDGDPAEALARALARVEGSYALAMVCTDTPDRIYVARRQSPLVVGIGEGETFLASDIPAVMSYTRQVRILQDGDLGILTREGFQPVRGDLRPLFAVTWEAGAAEKSGYEHFMLKEIHEQPQAIRDTLRGRMDGVGQVVLPELAGADEWLRQVKRVQIVGCGTAYHAGCVGKALLEKLLRLPVSVDLASEFRYNDPLVDEETLTIVISQSGETADTLAALREARAKGSRAVGVVNVVGSSVAREADYPLFTLAGPEICVCSTKAYSTQLVAMWLLALHAARVRGADGALAQETAEGLRTLPERVQEALAGEPAVRSLATRLAQSEDFFYLGRGVDFAVALEGALKLKEITYCHAEAYAAGEMKHGPLALINEGVPVLCLATQDAVREKMVSNIKEVKARGATCVAIVNRHDRETPQVVDEAIAIPSVPALLTPAVAIVPLQLLAYFIARELGRDIDQPRNLAKSVTVE